MWRIRRQHDLGRGGVVVGVGAERIAQLSDQRRCRDAPARDVADADVHDPIGPLHDVVPVAADLEARAARLVATRGIDAGDPRELGQQAALERHGDAVLLLITLAAVASALAQGPGLGAGACEDPGQQGETDQRRPRDQHELDDEAASRVPEDLGARAVEDDAPLGHVRARVRDHVARVAVQAWRVGQDAGLALPNRSIDSRLRGCVKPEKTS